MRLIVGNQNADFILLAADGFPPLRRYAKRGAAWRA
jgi:hypothetical protein